MENNMELQQVVYNVMVMQIKFGTFRSGERLSRIEDAAQWLLVSLDTMRYVYSRLKREGYITLAKSAGAYVKINYTEQEIEQHIQEFFSCRATALMDLCQSLPSLYTSVLCAGMKKSSEEKLDEIERLCIERGPLPPYEMIRHFQNIYGVLENDMLMRLVWQSFMFFHAPFLSVREHLVSVNESSHPLLKMVTLCRNKDFSALPAVINEEQDRLYLGLCRFYEKYSIKSSSPEQIEFSWSGYKKASQICYSLGLEMLIAITNGIYPAGAILPSLESLAKEKQVSVSTVRRTLSLLGDIGATKSINGVGTQVLSPYQTGENCDFTKASVRKRLLDCVQSMQVLTLSCKEISKITVASLDTVAITQFRDHLYAIGKDNRYERVPYSILQLIINRAPYKAIRTVYASLFQQLLWGYPLRGLRGSQEKLNAFFLPYLDALLQCLDLADAEEFSVKFEELMLYEMRYTIDQLVKLGVEEAAGLSL